MDNSWQHIKININDSDLDIGNEEEAIVKPNMSEWNKLVIDLDFDEEEEKEQPWLTWLEWWIAGLNWLNEEPEPLELDFVEDVVEEPIEEKKEEKIKYNITYDDEVQDNKSNVDDLVSKDGETEVNWTSVHKKLLWNVIDGWIQVNDDIDGKNMLEQGNLEIFKNAKKRKNKNSVVSIAIFVIIVIIIILLIKILNNLWVFNNVF